MCCLWIYLKSLRRTKINLRDIRYSDRNLNQVRPEYNSRSLSVQQSASYYSLLFQILICGRKMLTVNNIVPLEVMLLTYNCLTVCSHLISLNSVVVTFRVIRAASGTMKLTITNMSNRLVENNIQVFGSINRLIYWLPGLSQGATPEFTCRDGKLRESSVKIIFS
jgi:hypothetical protein